MPKSYFKISLIGSFFFHILGGFLLYFWPVGKTHPYDTSPIELRIFVTPQTPSSPRSHAASPPKAAEKPEGIERKETSSHPKNTVTASETPEPGSITENSSCISQIQQQIKASLDYPLSLRRRRIQGEVTLKISLNSGARLESCEISKSSGHPELDQLALTAVARAEPFGCDSSEKIGRLKLSLPIAFRLQ